MSALALAALGALIGGGLGWALLSRISRARANSAAIERRLGRAPFSRETRA